MKREIKTKGFLKDLFVAEIFQLLQIDTILPSSFKGYFI